MKNTVKVIKSKDGVLIHQTSKAGLVGVLVEEQKLRINSNLGKGAFVGKRRKAWVAGDAEVIAREMTEGTTLPGTIVRVYSRQPFHKNDTVSTDPSTGEPHLIDNEVYYFNDQYVSQDDVQDLWIEAESAEM